MERRPQDAGHRSGVLRAMRAQSMEFSELNIEYGHSYQSAAVVPDGSAAPAPADDIRVYQPSTRPGAPLPHGWIDDEDGNRRPVTGLVAPGRFLLIAGEDGQAWCQAAGQLATEADAPLDALRIGHLDGDYHDPRCTWLRHSQIASDGAILVRPHRFIAWRCLTGSGEPRAALAAALSQRPAGRHADRIRCQTAIQVPSHRFRGDHPASPRVIAVAGDAGGSARVPLPPTGAVFTPLSGIGWPVRHGLGLFLSDLRQVGLPTCLVILLQGPGDCRVLLLSHLRLSLGQVGLGLRGLRLSPRGLCLGPCLRLGPCGLCRRLAPGMFAHDRLLASEPQRTHLLSPGP